MFPTAQKTRDSGQTLLLIQALRAVAVLLVSVLSCRCHHIPRGEILRHTRPFGHLPDMGHAGVDLFFVISGFVIAFAHYGDIGQPHRAWLYLRKRLVRIYPPYFVAFAIMLLASIALHTPSADISPGNVIDNLLLIRRHMAARDPASRAWTLRSEVLFYALFLLSVS